MKRKLLLLQGGPGLSNEYLRDEFSFCSKDYEIKTLEYPGCEAGSASKASSMGQIVKKISDFTANFGGDFDVLAHSWGSYVLLETFRTHPNFTSGKLLFLTPTPATWDALLKVGQKIQKFKETKLSKKVQQRLTELKPDGNGPEDREYIQLIKPLYVRDEKFVQSLKFIHYNQAVETDLFSEMTGYSQEAVLRKLKNQIYVLLGDSDFISKEDLKDLCIVAKKTAVFQNCGHSPFVEDRVGFSKAVLEILADSK